MMDEIGVRKPANENAARPSAAPFYFWLLVAFFVSVFGALALLREVFG
ncbi:MAG TPA: hypothetical protein VM639_24395 [Dongiaceae bacterium]|nr:hypothetical protein [Dongiaceae bacterium]